MKATLELPDHDVEAARRLTGVDSVQEAVAKAVATFVRDHEDRVAAAKALYGSMPDLFNQEELSRSRAES